MIQRLLLVRIKNGTHFRVNYYYRLLRHEAATVLTMCLHTYTD